jgi:hypothetical protein
MMSKDVARVATRNDDVSFGRGLPCPLRRAVPKHTLLTDRLLTVILHSVIRTD